VYEYLLPAKPPPPTSKKTWVCGISWEPLKQIEIFRLNPEIKVAFSASEFIKILGANPDRLAWYARWLITSSGAATPIVFSPSPSTVPAAPIQVENSMPYRCHVAEWPGLCQGEWYAYSTDWPAILLVWEMVKN